MSEWILTERQLPRAGANLLVVIKEESGFSDLKRGFYFDENSPDNIVKIRKILGCEPVIKRGFLIGDDVFNAEQVHCYLEIPDWRKNKHELKAYIKSLASEESYKLTEVFDGHVLNSWEQHLADSGFTVDDLKTAYSGTAEFLSYFNAEIADHYFLLDRYDGNFKMTHWINVVSGEACSDCKILIRELNKKYLDYQLEKLKIPFSLFTIAFREPKTKKPNN